MNSQHRRGPALRRRLATLFDGVLEDGQMTLEWDGCDARGRPQAAGLYMLRLESGRTVAGARMIMLP